MRSKRYLLVFMLAALLAVLTAGSAQSSPVPAVTAQLTFATDCSWAHISMTWTNWRTTSVAMHVEDANSQPLSDFYTLDAGKNSGGPKASRNGGWGATFTQDWSGQQVRAFAEAFNNKGVGELDRSDLATCTPTG
jgi:hypothetical protein